MDERLVQFDEKMQKTMNNLSEEFGSIRAGRANPHVLDKLRVDYYGTPTPIQQVANVNVPEPRMIQIQPWEASMVKEIEKVIMTSDLGINPTNDGKTKLKAPSGTLSTAEAISVVNNGLAMAGYFGDGQIHAEDLVSGILGAVVKDPVQDKVVWQEYMETVVKNRDGWKDIYRDSRDMI